MKFLYDQDPISKLLDSEAKNNVEVELETMERTRELMHFGGFLDAEYLSRTLAEEFLQTKSCFKDAFDLPFAAISQKILCHDIFPLFPIKYSDKCVPSHLPVSVSYYMEPSDDAYQHRMIGYMLFQIPEGAFPDVTNCICIARGLNQGVGDSESSPSPLEATLLSVPDGYSCVDLCLYKEGQIVMLLNETRTSSESSRSACIMLVQASDLPFASISSPSSVICWKIEKLKVWTYQNIQRCSLFNKHGNTRNFTFSGMVS